MPIPSFIADAEVKTLVASCLKLTSESALPPYWDTIVTQCNFQALQDVQDRLVARGFSLAQIAAFDRGGEYQRDIAVYHALIKGAVLEQYDASFIKLMDRRNELATVMLTCNSIAQDPGGPVQTQEMFFPPVNFGRQSSSDDIFSLDSQF